MNPALKAMSRLASGHNYDVLDLHADKFTHPIKEFQPRIKNLEKSSSKLRESKCYEPPRRQKKHKKDSGKSDNNYKLVQINNKEQCDNSTINESKNFEDSDEEDLYPTKLNSSEIFNASFGSKRLTASQVSLKRAAEK